MTHLDPVAVARDVVDRLAATLVGREHGGVRVAGLLHYGAVEVAPAQLVVWLLLDGPPVDDLPEWLELTAAPPSPADARMADGAWLTGLRTEIRSSFAAAGWPDPHGPRVLVDSGQRVAAGGGRRYFA